MELLLLVIEALIPMSLVGVLVVLIAIQFLPNENMEAEESDSNLLL